MKFTVVEIAKLHLRLHVAKLMHILIRNSSMPEFWYTVPSDVKPIHQALNIFAPPAVTPFNKMLFDDELKSLGTRLS